MLKYELHELGRITRIMDITTLPVKTKTGTPITLEEGKKQLQIEAEFTKDDEFITSLIEIAIDKLENDTNSDVLETDNVLTFPSSAITGPFVIHQAPFLSATKLERRNGTVWSEIDESNYQVTAGFSKFELELILPVVADQLRFSYKTGYVAADMPKVLKGAAKLKVADLFDNERQGYTLNVAANRAYEALIGKHVRVYWG